MRVLLRADVVQLDDVAALEAALNGALTGDLGSNQYAILRTMPKKCIIPYSKPVDMVGVRRVTGATSVLFVTGTVNDNWVVEGSYRLRSQVKHFPSNISNEWDKHTLSGSIKGPHIENVNALHLSDKFETLKTGSLLDIGGNGTRLGTRGNQILLGLDLYTRKKPRLANGFST